MVGLRKAQVMFDANAQSAVVRFDPPTDPIDHIDMRVQSMAGGDHVNYRARTVCVWTPIGFRAATPNPYSD